MARNLTRRFDDNTLIRATFSINSDHIIAISRHPKLTNYKLLVLNVKSVNDEVLESFEINQATFQDLENFYICNIYQCEINITLIAGVDFS